MGNIRVIPYGVPAQIRDVCLQYTERGVTTKLHRPNRWTDMRKISHNLMTFICKHQHFNPSNAKIEHVTYKQQLRGIALGYGLHDRQVPTAAGAG
jgi:hypothetical protein